MPAGERPDIAVGFCQPVDGAGNVGDLVGVDGRRLRSQRGTRVFRHAGSAAVGRQSLLGRSPVMSEASRERAVQEMAYCEHVLVQSGTRILHRLLPAKGLFTWAHYPQQDVFDAATDV